jgi:uncharacterized LabA/DUF88 family protein
VAQPVKEPDVKRAIAFFDGQNLYRHAKAAFGHHHPNFDPIKLTDAVCAPRGWSRRGVRFYTGTPLYDKQPMWHGYWSNRLLAMRRSGILVTHRVLRYQDELVIQPDGSEKTISIAHEKGIDVRLALDVVRMARQGQFDVALIFSQDGDLAEVVSEVKDIAINTGRWLRVASAYPFSSTATAKRGIDGAEWIKMDQAFYDECLDPKDYRPKLT